jgi:hypothetical protein
MVLLSVGALYAQSGSAQSFYLQGDTLRRAYRFSEAIEAFQQAILTSTDTLIMNRAELHLIWCQNGQNMLQYAVDVKTLGSASVPKEEFYLYLSADPHAFWATPPKLFSEISQEYPAFVSPVNKTIIFTGRSSASNNLDLYISRLQNDSLWSYPQPMESSINSSGNECYPVLSADGHTLFFASDGHYGMGGFDLYVSSFDESTETWSQAQNMGFPFSSTENDLAFMPAPDGLSALVVSDRAGDEDLLHIYHIEYELNPLRHDLRDRTDLPLLAQLVLEQQKEDSDRDNAEIDLLSSPNGQSDYIGLVQIARKIRDELLTLEKKLALNRDTYTNLLQEDERFSLAKIIEEEEMALMELNKKYRLAGIEVQNAEMEFLHKGIIPAVEQIPLQKESYQAPSHPFLLQKGILGSIDTLSFALPIIKERLIDYGFRVGSTTEIIAEVKLPDYLFYRIQLAVLSTPARPSTFNGISPVFENFTTDRKYLYCAGQFNSYSEASAALPLVQRAGFKTAIVTAFNQGKSVTVTNARKLEQTLPKMSYRVSLGVYPQGLPPSLLTAVKQLCDKDLARVMGNGWPMYVVGPFGTLKEAQKLQNDLIGMGFEEIVVEII